MATSSPPSTTRRAAPTTWATWLPPSTDSDVAPAGSPRSCWPAALEERGKRWLGRRLDDRRGVPTPPERDHVDAFPVAVPAALELRREARIRAPGAPAGGAHQPGVPAREGRRLVTIGQLIDDHIEGDNGALTRSRPRRHEALTGAPQRP